MLNQLRQILQMPEAPHSAVLEVARMYLGSYLSHGLDFIEMLNIEEALSDPPVRLRLIHLTAKELAVVQKTDIQLYLLAYTLLRCCHKNVLTNMYIEIPSPDLDSEDESCFDGHNISKFMGLVDEAMAKPEGDELKELLAMGKLVLLLFTIGDDDLRSQLLKRYDPNEFMYAKKTLFGI